jgi:hypothetical protein
MASNVLYFKIDPLTGRTPANIRAIISQIDALINSLLNTAITSVANGNIIQYQLDTGQTKTNVTYSTTESITLAINQYENLRTRYVNMLSPRSVQLVDRRNLRR